MFCLVSLIILLISPVLTKPRYVELDEDERLLYRAAYDTPSYDHDQFDQEDDMQLGKLDLLKDSMWTIKAKIKELKAFNKALAANLLSTKLKVKELLSNKKVMKKHQHDTPERDYPVHNYQPQPYPMHEQQIPQDEEHHLNHDPYYGY